MHEFEPGRNKKIETIETEASPEFIKELEKTPFITPAQASILLVKAGKKPASWIDFVIRHESNGKIDKKIPEEEVQRTILLIKSNLPCKTERKTVDIRRNESGRNIVGGASGVKIGEEETISFMIGATTENLERLSLAVKAKNDREIGLSLGFVPSAVEAYCAGNSIDFPPKSVRDDFKEALVFNPGGLSPDHWKEELMYYQKWADYIKKASPSLFNKIMQGKLK